MAATTALCYHNLLPLCGEVSKQLRFIIEYLENKRTWGNHDSEVTGIFTVHLLTGAIHAPIRGKTPLSLIVPEQSSHAPICENENAASMATVAAVWTTKGNILLPSKANNPPTPITCLNIDFNPINQRLSPLPYYITII